MSIILLTGKTTSEPDFYAVGENGTLIVTAADGVLANDFTNRGVITASSFIAPTHGTLSLNLDGSFTYIPDPGFTGIDTFTYYTGDGFLGGTSSATVTLNVTHPAPLAANDTYTVFAGHTLVEQAGTGLLANDLPLTGTSLVATSFSQAQHGTLNVSLDGSITYTPDAGYVGTDSFIYYESDGTATSSASVTIDVTDAGPVANNDTYAVWAGQTLSIGTATGLLANDVSENGTLVATSFSEPLHGSLNVSLDGSLYYVPNPGYTGTDSFTYYISDGVLSSSAVAHINVAGTPPVANNDFYGDVANGTLNVSAAHGLLANDFDPDGAKIIATSYSAPLHGSLNVSLDGSFEYVPTPGYAGTDRFTYYISDGTLTSSAVATIVTDASTSSILVNINPDTYGVRENTTLSPSAAYGLLANDFANHGTIVATSYGAPLHGSLNVSLDGSFEYVPDAGYAGPDSFVYYAADGSITGGATVSLDVYNAGPVANNDVYSVLGGHTLVEQAPTGLLANDLSLSGTHLVATSYSAPSHGTLNVSLDGAITYTPDAGYVGTDSFIYFESDGTASASATVTINVADAAPVANNDSYSVRAGQELSISATNGLLANDSAENGTLVATSFSDAAHGSLNVSLDGSFYYTPDAGYTGTDSFTYYISDGVLQSSAVAYITVADAAPVANPDYYNVGEDSSLTIAAAQGVLANDFDPNNDKIVATSYSQAQHGLVNLSITGALSYTPDAGFSGTDSFTYYISDGVLSASNVVTITVVACYAAGTRIATPQGEMAVEALSIGDEVLTLHAGARRIKWIGQRSYAAPFANHASILPICLRADAIAPGVPMRDLYVSPGHAICIDDALVHASRLVNGVSIFQLAAVEQLTYYHIELDTHEVLLAENCPAESFADETFRNAFQNAAEYHALYPAAAAAAQLCLPRHDSGLTLHAIQRRLAQRAGITQPAGHGPLRGYVDQAGPDGVFGWAQDEHAPERPVYLDIFDGPHRIGRVIANLFREDVRNAGYGSGHHGFEFTPPANASSEITVRRAVDGVWLDAAGMQKASGSACLA